MSWQTVIQWEFVALITALLISAIGLLIYGGCKLIKKSRFK